jgi:serine/threonine protein kinase
MKFSHEFLTIRKFRHPFIAETFEFLKEPHADVIVSEFAENGPLFEFLSTRGDVGEAEARRVFCQLLSVLDYLHNTKHVAHRDLGPDHLLVDRHGNLRVIDFGLGRWLSAGVTSTVYDAPEVLHGQPCTRASDVWSAGVLLYAMVTGRLPFDGASIESVRDHILHGQLTFPGEVSTPLADLLREMLAKNSEQRITVDRIKEHAWIAQTSCFSLVKSRCDEQEELAHVIDTEIMRRMAALQFDPRPLNDQILMGDWTPLTAAYRMLLKEKTTERIKDLASAAPAAKVVRGNCNFSLAPPSASPTLKKRPPKTLRPPMLPRSLPPPHDLAKGKAPRTLQVPAPIQTAQRRMSRPCAVAKLDLPGRPRGVSSDH